MKQKEFLDVFGSGYDRFAFPEGIRRVTAGRGGEAILILGEERTALLDLSLIHIFWRYGENPVRVESGFHDPELFSSDCGFSGEK